MPVSLRRLRAAASAFLLVMASRETLAQAGALGVSESRSGSGTSWLPDASPMRALHRMVGPWSLMTHGVAFLQYDKQNGPRGDDQIGLVNWGMVMAGRGVWGGRLRLRGMASLEPWTIGSRGYPLLLQTGESYRGAPLVDRQHPHDLFMEIAAQYERPVAQNLAVSLYVAPVGEPALGPVAFPHRVSAENDPLAPIAHHWQDATHVVFGAVTTGVFTRTLRVEASAFNGREPDENRTNFDYTGRSLDSYSGRVTWNPTVHWALTGGFAWIKSPEGLRPDESLHRTVFSVAWARPIGGDGSFALTSVYGVNRRVGATSNEPATLVEANLDWHEGRSVFARAELVRKEQAELNVPAAGPDDLVDVPQFTLGTAGDMNASGAWRWAVGVRGSVSVLPSTLSTEYGGRTPVGVAVYLRLRPARVAAMHHMMDRMPMDATKKGAP